MESDVAAQCSHYAEATIATSLKEHSKRSVSEKPVHRPRLTLPAVERRSRLRHETPDDHRDLLRRRQRLSERMCMSDDEADGDKVMRRSPGRLSYSDDELSVRHSPRRYGSHCTHCLRLFSSDSAESAPVASPTQSHNALLQQGHAHPPRPERRGCHACNSPARLR